MDGLVIKFMDKDGNLIMNRQVNARYLEYYEDLSFLKLSVETDARMRGVKIISPHYQDRWKDRVKPGKVYSYTVDYLSTKVKK